LGGDEFAVLLPLGDVQIAQVIARRLLDAVEQPILLEGHRAVIGGSIGIASFPEHGEDLNTLLRHADLAMYAAKRSNSGFAIYDPLYEEQGQNRVSLMAELRHAVEHDELTLYYQPKVPLVNCAITQVEALVRWVHPERGFIPPDEFIPFAEHTGYIKMITRWVLDHALRQAVRWRDAGLNLNISINLSTRDLLNPELPEIFVELMKSHKAAADWLSLEITESAIMADPTRALGVLELLRGLGIHISVDDFGTGYSSLAYLKKLPVGELKIDKSFVINMANDKGDASIVRSTIDLGHNMGLKVVAEGVENRETWDLLRAWGCDIAQGYFISRPLSPDKLVEWLPQSEWQPGAATGT
jgi:predicted signal transduction protein with EAL and GGDEF domain